MKKIFLIIAFILCSFCLNAQTVVSVNDTNMGYIEKYNSYSVTVDTLDYDVDSVGDTVYNIGYDTNIIPNHYDYRAFAYNGYKLHKWVVVTTYTKWITAHTIYDSLYYNTVVYYECDTMDNDSGGVEISCMDGWLIYEGGFPDITEEDTLSNVSGINITAYFVSVNNDTLPDTLSIRSVESNKFTIYPNPTTKNITIDGDFDWIFMYSNTGKLVYKGKGHTIDISNLPKGTYFIKVGYKGGTCVEKIVKQ
ncbi:MAG: T9SS type A sorting domain-containing protein [Bacteroidaceae bacterium]|nr:T9SS type A sorting domain-containing protein [Bacteroidaceae bacterium]